MPERNYLDIPLEIKAEDIQADGTFKGYGSLFDRAPDVYGDIVSQGAFSKTLAKGGRNKTGVAMLWQHRSDKIPGVWTSILENKRGLPVEGKLATNTVLGNDVYEIMKLGAEAGTFKLGLSIGYDAVEYVKDEKKKIRDLKEVELWEISLVTFPAKLGATVLTIKMIENAKTERELEKSLREAGLSKNAAQYIVKLCKPSLREVDAGVANRDSLSVILDGLKEVNQDLHDLKQQKQGLSGILNSLKQVNI